MLGICAIHKDYTDGTYFLMYGNHYITLDTTTQAMDMPIPYGAIEGMPTAPEQYMGFQPSFEAGIYFLALGNIVVSIRFNDRAIEIVPGK